MTVRDLIKLLSTIPPSADVFVEAGEYAGDEREVTDVEYRPNVSLTNRSNTVLLKRG